MAARRETDVFIVGGGPAGLAAGIAARRRGFRVMVADSTWPPIDKACGEGVMPNGVAALRELGVAVDGQEAFPFGGIRFVEPGLSAEARFPTGVGLGVRRTTLHSLLAERAAAVGATLLWGTRVRGLTAAGVVLDDGVVPCRWVIGADGERSRVRGWMGLAEGRSPLRRFGFRRHFGVTPWADVVEVYWCRDAQVVVTPVGPSEVCVGLMSRDPHVRLDDLALVCPELGRRLEGAPPTTAEKGATFTSRRLPSVIRGRRALIGDASGSIDAITGEGLSLLFHQALKLGDALAHDDLERYQAAHRRVGRIPAFMAQLMLMMDAHPRLRHRALRALADGPALFARLLALHVGAVAPAEFGVGSLCALGWRLLTA